MPLRKDIKKVMVIGSGPIIIGQAAEFDYSGSQACRALKEEGIEVVLINSNPATIMTDENMADRVYIEPLTLESITEIIKKEKPDGLIPTLGGQIALNLAINLAETGILEELKEIAVRGFKHSLIGQILIEKSIKGWKEIEYEVMRDAGDNCIVVCNMENFDPVGVHTGDSIVAAPSQTLTDKEYQMFRSSALKIIKALGIEGGCNVQYALDPESFQYYIIEVNPRVSRSSALASKATGYPIAKVSAKIALGYRLDEIKNAVTGETTACFEPALDYVVFKIPRWPFDKFHYADRKLGTQMKATGEVMALERSLEASMLKAVRSMEIGCSGLYIEESKDLSDKDIRELLKKADDSRLFIIAEAMRRGWTVEEVFQITEISTFFLNKIKNIIDIEKELNKVNSEEPDRQLLKKAKEKGFSDREIGIFTGNTEAKIKNIREKYKLKPVYKMVDTCAAEFEAETPYYYSSYEEYNEAEAAAEKKVIVLGSGPIRIGQGIEFDYCSVHSAWALAEAGYESIIVNNNPETVSTDFDTSDRLYFEPLTKEDIIHIVDNENPEGVIVQFGGQTAVNLSKDLADEGVNILGTPINSIDLAEDRERFIKLLKKINIPVPDGRMALSLNEAEKIAKEIEYPVLVRPSYVLGGRAMEVVYNKNELKEYMANAVKVSADRPVLIDKYLIGNEIEVDAVSDGETVIIPGIMEHIEKAGVHSGDSIAVYPPQKLSEELKEKVSEYTIKLAKELKIKGVLNIQYVVSNNKVYVIEVNPRSSRTIPYLSKVTGVPMIELATKAILGHKLKKLGWNSGIIPEKPHTAVKVPVFSFSKLARVDTNLGPEMKSTGEVLGLAEDYETALYKGLTAAGIEIPQKGKILATIADDDKKEALKYLKKFVKLGFAVAATEGTAAVLKEEGIKVEDIKKISEGSPNSVEKIFADEIDLVINTMTKGKIPERDGFKIRRAAAEMGIPCLTSLDTAAAMLRVLKTINSEEKIEYRALQDYN